MKKSISLFTALFLFCTLNLSAQKQPTRIFKKDQTDIYLTVGLVPTFMADGATQTLLPLNIGADFMVGNNFSVGGSFGHSISETSQQDFIGGENGKLKNRYYEFTLKTGLHITKHDNMSIYGGFMLSYHLSKVEATAGDMDKISFHTGIKPSVGKVLPGGYLGFKYALKKNLTAMAEVGYGVSIFRIGVGYRLK